MSGSGGWMGWSWIGEGGAGGVIPEIVRGLLVLVVEGMRIEVVVVGIEKGCLVPSRVLVMAVQTEL